MTTIVKNYPIFEPNQVLTSNQLNDLANYLDQQNRLTRVKLIGMGIVCGLELTCKTDPDSLLIGKGVGVTSEGFLTPIGDDCEVTRYRVYEKPESIEYDPFDQVEGAIFYELLTAKAEVEGEVEDITKEFLEDKVILLFVECFDNDLKSCLGKSCDQLGVDRILNIRKLAVDRSVAEEINKVTGAEDLSDKNYNLPDLILPRVIFNPNDDHSKYYLNFSEHYRNSLKETYFKLLSILPQTYEDCKPILGNLYEANPFDHPAIIKNNAKWEKYLAEDLLMEVPLFGVQYFYDYVKDLILTYQEFRETICGLFAVCCPDMGAFPKHLFLGLISPELAVKESVEIEFRQEFLQAPIYNNYKSELEKARLLHQRLVLQMELFQLDELIKGADQAITPSCEKKSPLSARSIPFYYQIRETSTIIENQTLEAVWSYRPCQKGTDQVLSYARNTMGSIPSSRQKTPLLFDLDDKNFLRIEGHLNTEALKSKELIEAFRDKFNLSFDVKLIHLGDVIDAKGRTELPDCLCTDLQPTYAIWRHKLLFLINNILRFTYRSKEVVLSSSQYAAASVKPFQSNDSSGMRESLAKMTNPEMMKKASTIQRMAEGEESAVSESAVRLINYINDIDSITRNNVNIKSSRSLSQSANEQLSLIDQLNNCLQSLVAETKPGIKQMSDLDKWLEAYKCTLQVNIDNMVRQSRDSVIVDDALRSWLAIFIYCLLHKVLQALAIHPYISMRLLVDTLNTRIEQLEESMQFSNFIKKHPGLEHQAGVKPGGTFVLLQQVPHEFEDQKVIDVNNETERESVLTLLEQQLADLGKVAVRDRSVAVEESAPPLQILTKSSARAKSSTPTDGGAKAIEVSGAAAYDNAKKVNEVELYVEQIQRGLRVLRGDATAANIDEQQIETYAKLLDGKVIGDFTLPYLCCDDCADLPTETVSLDPLAVPQCGVVLFREKPDLTDPNGEAVDPEFPQDFEYQPLEMQLLNNLYDPSIYEVRISKVPSFGTHSFVSKVYEPQPSLNKQILRYIVDPNLVRTESLSTQRLLVVDEMEYEIYDLKRNEVVDSSTITLFIFNLNYGEQNVVCVGGQVFELVDGQERIGVARAKVKIEKLGLEATSNSEGTYLFDAVPVGEQVYTIESPPGYIYTGGPVTQLFTSDFKQFDFQVQQFQLPDLFASGFFVLLDVDPDSNQGIAVKDFYRGNLETYAAQATELEAKAGADLDDAIKGSVAFVNSLPTSEGLSTTQLNTDFGTHRKNMVSVIKEQGTKANIHNATLEVMTLSYLDRLAQLQTSKVLTTTTSTLQQTANEYNSIPEIQYKTSVEEWRSKIKENAPSIYLNTVDENLKLT